ncbi:hypothetical protein BRETT_002855 [Brettanomyces bruxellensis]|uniref:RGS domain-containing protein n=1 Tax=Dekkera bruxellensis TaxID=5007 RepID=A0A871R861_DEKBR|nr:uncharacterized protein BRETT_002855 [Brettanomyces bruxellensis]QOU22673.1 hypothetical protein BRETT_002855 [Brettanomyces bruxellensis]
MTTRKAADAGNTTSSNISGRSDLNGYYDSLDGLNKSESFDEKMGMQTLNPQESGYTSNETASIKTIKPLNRWPTLFEILNKKTRSPVDLWSFYVYMRDTQKSIDYLDFWIDTVQHMNLCKVYVKGLKESLIVSEHLKDVTREEGEELKRSTVSRHNSKSSIAKSHKRESSGTSSNRDSASSSMLLDLLMKNDLLEGGDAHRLSSFLRGEAAVRSSDPIVNAKIEELKRRSLLPSSGATGPAGPRSKTPPTSSGDKSLGRSPSVLRQQQVSGRTSSTSLQESYERTSRIGPELVEALIDEDYMENSKDSHFVTRTTLRKSSKNILNTYFLEGSEKRVLIPDDMREQVIYAVETEGRDDPEVFDESREYVFKAMEHEAYPNFLRDVAMCNVTSVSAVIRMFLAILCAFAAFWTGYTLIFLDYQPKKTRAVVTLPFFLASYFLFSSFYKIDPVLCFLGFSESRSSHSGLIRMREPFVKKLLLKRSLFVLITLCLVAAAFSVLFALVPGTHLHH